MVPVRAASDKMARGVLYETWLSGIRVPEQLGVGGMDDLSESAYFTPPLIAIEQDFYRHGELAVRKLLSLTDTELDDQEVVFDMIVPEHELIIGSSTQRSEVGDQSLNS